MTTFRICILATLTALQFGTTLLAQTAPSQKPGPPRSTTPALAAGMMNADVIKLVQAGLSEGLIASAIRQAKVRAFDLSADGLVALKQAGVSDAIMALMLNPNEVADPVPGPAIPAREAPPTPPATTLPVTAGPKDNPLQAHEPGICAMQNGKLIQLEPTVVTQGGVGGKSLAMNAATLGFKRVKAKAEIRGSKASMRVPDTSDFYFYGSAFNPNEFVLARLESEDAKRTIVVGHAGGFGGVKSGLEEKDQVSVTNNKLGSGIYKVATSRELKPGEYAFINIVDQKSPRLWDFGVDR